LSLDDPKLRDLAGLYSYKLITF